MEEYKNEGDSSQTEEVIETETQVEEKNDDIDVDKLLETNKKLYARAKTAEAEAKRLKELEEEIKKLKETPAQESTQAESVSKEEVILFAQGFSLEEVEKIKTISKLENTGLLAAKESDVFKAWKASADAKKKDEDAELEISTGSPKARKKLDFNTPDLTPEQHRELFKKRFGR